MSTAAAVVDRFVEAWKRKSVDELMTFFTDDAVYENVPIDPPNQGVEAIRKTIEGFVGMAKSIEFVVHHQVASGSIVMNERTDRFELDSGWAEGRVMGVFEIEGDKIKAWRDYFDMAQFTAGMSGEGA